MRSEFHGHYRPTEEQFNSLWDEAIFAFDANVLLNVYRYKVDAQQKFLEVIHSLGERVWIPHQAALEYQEHRLDVILSQYKAYEILSARLEDLRNKARNDLKAYQNHAFIDTEKILRQFERCIDRSILELKRGRSRHPDLLSEDLLHEALTEILEGKIGEPYSVDELRHIHQDADRRFEAKTPPGFMDANKDGGRAYGDYVIWRQLLDYAKSRKHHVIFTTDDRKGDWWWRHDGKTIGPRPELVYEMKDYAGTTFYMYTSDIFLERAAQYLGLTKNASAVENVRAVLRENEENLGSSIADATVRSAAPPLHALHQDESSGTAERTWWADLLTAESALREAMSAYVPVVDAAKQSVMRNDPIQSIPPGTFDTLQHRTQEIEALQRQMKQVGDLQRQIRELEGLRRHLPEMDVIRHYAQELGALERQLRHRFPPRNTPQDSGPSSSSNPTGTSSGDTSKEPPPSSSGESTPDE